MNKAITLFVGKHCPTRRHSRIVTISPLKVRGTGAGLKKPDGERGIFLFIPSEPGQSPVSRRIESIDRGPLHERKGVHTRTPFQTERLAEVPDADFVEISGIPKPNKQIPQHDTGLKITQVLNENFAVFAGKLNTLDEYPLRFNSKLGLDRPGIGGFMNTSLVFNPIVARTVPYSAAAVGAAILKDGEPLFSLTFMDPRERATIGLEDLYAEGVVIMPDLTLHGEILGRPSTINLGGTYSNAVYTSVDPASYLILPSGIVAGQRTGSWSLYANAYHALWVDPHSESRHWGVFGQFGISDGDPNPIRFVANGGIAGRSMLHGRTRDTFGVAFFYLGLSDNFKSLTAPVLPQQDEMGGELFYNIALTPWCRWTADLQIAQPSTQAFDTVIIPGMRMEVVF